MDRRNFIFSSLLGVAQSGAPPGGVHQQLRLSESEGLPYAFEYGGVSSDHLLGGWERGDQAAKTELGTRQIITWDDPRSGLRVQWSELLYAGFTAVERRLSFENRGNQPSKVLGNVQVLRQHIAAGEMDLVYARGGGSAGPRDLETRVRRIGPQPDRFHLGADMGWSSNCHLPFWLLLAPGGDGFYYGLGWSGQWVAQWALGSDRVIQVEAGMEYLNVRLKPGEGISQPTLLLGSFTGGRWAGHNAIRRILYERYIPRLDGERVMPPVSWNSWATFGNRINENPVLEMVDKVAPLGLEYFCIDAGWYNVDFWDCGDWRVNPKKFPHGLEPVSAAIKSRGMRMGLWCDPERVTRAAYDQFEHKEWLLPANNAEPQFVWFVDLGIPEARRWMVELVGGLVRSLSLEWLRWDLNQSPLGMWQIINNQAPERVGMAEIRYVEGLYEVWDSLLNNHPKLLIEGCAGGARRVDLETVRRCHTLWKSDLSGIGNETRAQLTHGNLFLPGNMLNSDLKRLDTAYDYHCQFGGPLGFEADFRDFTALRMEEAARIITRYKELRRYIVEDYYPLFDFDEDLLYWDGWQFHDAKEGSGFFAVFRVPDSTFVPAGAPPLAPLVRLRGVDPNRHFVLTREEGCKSDVPVRVSGKQLREGLSIRMDSRPECLLVRYQPSSD